MATLKDVAQRAGVTVTTISRMLNHRVNVSPKTRARIEQAMLELDYQPNEIAQSLIKQRSNIIGLIVPSARNFFFSMIIDCIERYAALSGYKLLLCISNLELRKEKEYFNMLKSNKVAGVILTCHTQNLEEHITLTQPIVALDHTVSHKIPSICADDYDGGRLAAEHLLERGCGQLAYISGSTSPSVEADTRYAGFRDACRALGAAPPVVVNASEQQFIAMRYDDLVKALFLRYPGVDGVFASNDIIAAQILQYCAEADIPVPRKLKVVGYDDVELASLCFPRLTTIRQPVEAICKNAVEYVVCAANGETVPHNVTFPVELVVREST